MEVVNGSSSRVESGSMHITDTCHMQPLLKQQVMIGLND